jgi:hypothetical protein
MRDICLAAGLLEHEIALTEVHATNPEDCPLPFYESTAFDKLFNHFCGTGEMPIGVAKARTGEPDVWILNRLAEACNTSQSVV